MADNKYTVVVAEDEELLLNNLIKKIERTDLGFEVVASAQTGIQAYDLLKDHMPDVLITDIRMPAMDGIALLTKAREHFPLMKFIIISGFSDFEYARSAITLQVSDYLLKPVDPDELKNALQSLKNKFQAEQSAYEDIFNDELSYQAPETIASTLKDYLVQNYNTDVNLNLIANNMHYSPSYLTKVFQQQYDSTPSKFITSLRMQKASHLLLHNPELSIKQVGEAVGYNEQGYFSRIFKKQMGVSPFEYREN